jgi:hypothetical protein
MTACKLIAYAAPEGPPYYANAPMKTMWKCETHNWPMEISPDPAMCPIGRIELAADQATDRIISFIGEALDRRR